jgi:capsular polysaccharide biosynthesis protein
MNNQYEAQTYEDEIDLVEIFGVLKRKLIFIILAFVIGAGAAFGYMYFFVTPMYKATSLIYIFSKTTSITSLADLQIGSNLTEDFELIAKTRDVIESVIEDLGLNMSYETMVKKIEVSNPTDSHMMQVTAEDADPVLAADISNSLANKLRDQIADIMNTDKPSLVEKAVPPTQKSSPALTRNSLIAGIIVAVIMMIIFIARYLMDDTIKDEDDVKKYLNMETLAAIPERRDAAKANKKKK